MPHRRWTSRKFLLSLSVQITAIAVLIYPAHESTIVELSESITALVVMLLSTWGFVHSETSLDRATGQTDSSDTAVEPESRDGLS